METFRKFPEHLDIDFRGKILVQNRISSVSSQTWRVKDANSSRSLRISAKELSLYNATAPLLYCSPLVTRVTM